MTTHYHKTENISDENSPQVLITVCHCNCEGCYDPAEGCICKDCQDPYCERNSYPVSE
jgi:hypothetical protein